jgi:UDP:flavonoid glycosyltransferase YjiC (YdhE family)
VSYQKVFILSPPFYSHLQPLLSIGRAFSRLGAQVTLACTLAFEEQILEAGLQFRELELSRNANSGVAGKTEQRAGEADRLQAFFDATRQGPIETLTLQALERQRDMLAEPERVLDEIGRIAADEAPDLFVVDQLSYAATLALYTLDLPFVTFCTGHPTYVPQGDQLFGVPYAWPEGMCPGKSELASLRFINRKVEQQFTAECNRVIGSFSRTRTPVANAFRLTSTRAILFNYPDFGHLQGAGHTGTHKIFVGYAFEPDTPHPVWMARLRQAKPDASVVMISFGTFLSERADVLERCIAAALEASQKSIVCVSAGSSLNALEHLRSERVFIEEFLPQRALLPHTDLVIFHGGCNTFTETLFYGKKMIILPFSSDQFAIARDAQAYELADVFAPNTCAHAELAESIERSLALQHRQAQRYWQHRVRQLGPEHAVRLLQRSGWSGERREGANLGPVSRLGGD